MADSAVFDGTQLNTGHYAIDNQTVDFGTQGVADALLTGQYRVEEYDQVAAGLNLTRTVSIPLKITSPNADSFVTDQQALTSSLAGANRFVPKVFTWTPDNSSHVSSFRVFGGSWVPQYDWLAAQRHIMQGSLNLICDWPVRGVLQSLGSSGSPLITNVASPASVTLSPSPVGDVPGDVTVFVKNRHATLPIRSLLIAGISQNTTWTAGVDQASWTLDAKGTRASSIITSVSDPQNIVSPVAHFTAPTLPSDRRFRVYLRCAHNLIDGAISFRVRLVSGSTEVIGSWRSLPQEVDSNSAPYQPTQAADVGAYMFPVGAVGDLGAQSTTVYVETIRPLPLVSGDYVSFREALFMPDDSTLAVETSDTAKTLAAAAGIIRVESDQVYDASGNPAGGAVVGANIRTLGGRYTLYSSQGYMAGLDATIPWAPESVDCWATYVPRWLSLA